MSDFYEQPVSNASHTDADGYACAAIVKKRYGKNVRTFFTNYGRELPPAAFVKGSKMFVTDFTLSEMDFQKCKNLGIDVVWIDHHKVNYEALQNKGYAFAGLRDDRRCGAYLTWQYLFPSTKMPRVVEIIDDYDRWQFKLPETRAFIAGLKMFEQRVSYRTCYIWDDLLSEDEQVAQRRIEIISKIGQKIMEYDQKRHQLMCEDLAYIVDWQGRKIMIANTKQANSMFFDSMDKSGVDALSILQYAPDVKKYRCSVYSPDDVKEVVGIAQMFPGGGGHPKAAGFQARDYPYPTPTPTTPKPLHEVIRKYHDLTFGMRQDAIVNQSACRNDKISLTSTLFKATFGNKNVLATNHPYISELINTLPSTVDLIDPDTGDIYKGLIGYVMTNSGWYRCGIKLFMVNFLNQSDFEQAILKYVPDAVGMYREDLGALGAVYWWYTKNPPVSTPIPIGM